MSRTIEDWKKRRLTAALQANDGNRSRTAEALGVSVRTVRNWINRYRLSREFPPRYGRQK